MALLITHPDYMSFGDKNPGMDEYHVKYYREFLEYFKKKHEQHCWHVLPKEMVHWWINREANF